MPDVKEINYKLIAKNMDDFLNETHPKFLFLGEDHDDSLANLQFLANPDIQAVFQKHGFHNIVLEARLEFQTLANQVAHGEKTSSQFADEIFSSYRETSGDQIPESVRLLYQIRGELIEQSSQRGLMIHFVENQHDRRQQAQHLHEIHKKVGSGIAQETQTKIQSQEEFHDNMKVRLQKVFKQNAGLSPQSQQEALNRTIEQGFRERAIETSKLKSETKAFSDWKKSFLDDRFAYDGKLADTIRSSTGDQKTVILYGSSHCKSLSAALGTQTASINLCMSRIAIIERIHNGHDLDWSTAYFDLSSGNLIKSDDAMNIGKPAESVVQDKQSMAEQIQQRMPG